MNSSGQAGLVARQKQVFHREQELLHLITSGIIQIMFFQIIVVIE